MVVDWKSTTLVIPTLDTNMIITSPPRTNRYLLGKSNPILSNPDITEESSVDFVKFSVRPKLPTILENSSILINEPMPALSRNFRFYRHNMASYLGASLAYIISIILFLCTIILVLLALTEFVYSSVVAGESTCQEGDFSCQAWFDSSILLYILIFFSVLFATASFASWNLYTCIQANNIHSRAFKQGESDNESEENTDFP